MLNKESVNKLADAIIKADGANFTIDCEIHWKQDEDDKTSTQTICYCSEEDYDKLADNVVFDNHIFYYLIDEDGAFKDIFNGYEWEIVEVYEDTFDLLWM